jgi:hypothetical protein
MLRPVVDAGGEQMNEFEAARRERVKYSSKQEET